MATTAKGAQRLGTALNALRALLGQRIGPGQAMTKCAKTGTPSSRRAEDDGRDLGLQV